MYHLKKSFSITLLVVLLVSTVIPAAAQDGGECEWKIGLVTDVGELNDQSFNESAWIAIQEAAEELGLGEECYTYIETQDTADYAQNIGTLIDDGFQIIVTSGYLLGTATRVAAQEYPDVYFIGTDQEQVNENWEYDPLPNVAGLVFDESVSGFLAGALAALMSETGTIGAVYGTSDVPPVVRYKLGYDLGAEYANPDIKVLSAYHPGTPDVAFTDPEWGSQTAKTMIDQGADVIFAAGGQTGNGALIAGCNADLPVIGVDFDQYESLPEVKPCIMSSALKGLVEGTKELIIDATEDEFEGGGVIGSASLASFHEWEDKVPDEVKEQIDEITAMIEEGEVQTCPIEDEEVGWNCGIAGLIPPISEGEAIVATTCTVCHDLDKIEGADKDADWEAIIDLMIEKGAELDDEEKAAVLDYLHGK